MDSAQPVLQNQDTHMPEATPTPPSGVTPPPSPTPDQKQVIKSASNGKLLVMVTTVLMIGVALVVLWISKDTKNSGKTIQQVPSTVLKPITLQLSWFNTAEFSGFFIAQDNGFYKDAGLDVTLLEAKPPEAAQDAIVSGKADFGVAGIDGIFLARERGHSMKALAAIYQQSPVTFITLKESGIEKPEDFVGKRVTIECGSNAEYPQRALLKKLLLADKITENCSTYSIDQLLNHDTDVFAGFVTNEPILLELLGHPVTNILVVDYGINYYANLLFTSEELIVKDRETVQKFVTASLKGYEYALAHQDEAVNATMKRKSGLGELSLEHQKKTMSVQAPLIFTGKTPLGWMEEKIWNEGAEILLEQGIIKEGYDIQSVYTNEFIKPE